MPKDAQKYAEKVFCLVLFYYIRCREQFVLPERIVKEGLDIGFLFIFREYKENAPLLTPVPLSSAAQPRSSAPPTETVRSVLLHKLLPSCHWTLLTSILEVLAQLLTGLGAQKV